MRIARVLGTASFVSLFMMATAASAEVRQPPQPGECGARCGLIPDGSGNLIDCGPCPGWCGDQVCSLGYGENHATCPADCPGGTCQSEGCAGRCGMVRDQCGRLINCGPCSSVCGDGLCDPGEATGCSDDCGANCHPLNHCGLRCGQVDDGCGSYMDCGACEGECGNGLCEPPELTGNCPEDCTGSGCVSAGCAGGCGQIIDSCGHALSCGPCGGASQCPNPNGICEPDLGEDHANCKWECATTCGNGTCDTPLERFRCPSDCGGAPPPDGVTAGGPYAGQVGEIVHFYGLVGGSLSASTYEWTFGDGGTANTLSPTHVYGAPGAYPVTLKVTTTSGLQVVAATSAAIAPIAQINGFDVQFRVWYDTPGDALWAHAEITYSGPPPPAPLTGLITISIWNPVGDLVYRSEPTPAVADADPVFVPALVSPMAGTWRGQADFGYRIEGEPIHYLGRAQDSALVIRPVNCLPLAGASPESPLTDCTVTMAPVLGTVVDGGSQG